jgi:hypothetical protein
MPLWGEDAWDHARWGLMGGELPSVLPDTDWFQIAYDSGETDILSLVEFSSALYAGSSTGGKIFKSTDGTTWTLAYDSPETRINKLHVFSNNIYAATGPNGLIYKSSDGSTWTLAYDGPDTDILTLETFSSNLYHAGTNAIIRTSSDGTTWTLAYDSGTQADIIYDLEVFSGQLYAASGDSLGLIFRSSDGTTWTLAYDSDQSVIQSLIVLGNQIFPSSTTLLAGSGDQFRIYKSTDGLTWSLSYDGLGTVGDVRSLFSTDTMVYAGTELLGVLYRSDNAIDWSISYDSPKTSIHDMTGFSQDCGTLYLGSDDVIYTMDNLVESDYVPDVISPDGGETITTDTFTVEWSVEDVYTEAVAHWDMEEAAGDSRADTIGDLSLTDNGNVARSTGKIGSFAADFASDYLSHSDNSVLSVGDNDFTIACWVNLDSKSDNRAIIAKWNGNTNNREYLLQYRSSDDRFMFAVTSDGTGSTRTDVVANSLGSPLTGTWYFIVAWHDSTNDKINIQVNTGTVDTASHTGGILDGSAEFTISSITVTGGSRVFYMDGRIDHVTLWKSLLTEEERTRLYNEGDGWVVPLLDYTIEYSRNFSTNRDWNTAVDDEGGNVGSTGSNLTNIVVAPKHDLVEAHWHLNEASGSRSDFIGANNLTDNNTVTQAEGNIFKAAQFTAANSEYLSIADNASLSMGNFGFAISCWAYLDSVGVERTFVSKWKEDTNDREYWLGLSSGGQIEFRGSKSGTSLDASASATSFGTAPTGTWFFVFAWFDPGDAKLKIQVDDNARNESVVMAGGFNDGAAEFRLGSIVNSGGSNASFMDGRLEEVTVWKTIPSFNQRNFLYNGGVGRSIRVLPSGNQLQATWNVLPIVDSSDMSLRIRAINGEDSGCTGYSSWNQSDSTFTLQNGPC